MEVVCTVGCAVGAYLLARVGQTVFTVASVVVEPGETILRPVRYVSLYKNNFRTLKDMVEELNALQERVIHKVQSARREGEVIEDEVERWLIRVNAVLQDADKLHNDPRHDSAVCSPLSFPNLRSRYQLSRQAKKLTYYLLELSEVGKGRFDHVTKTECEEIESRKMMKKDIMRALSDPNVTRIGIYGISGVGKTVLARQVAQLAKGEMFDAVYIIAVSQSLDVERIQCEIADLDERINKGESILIILDDVWEENILERLEIPLADDIYNGCKLLLTSRNLDVLRKNNTQKDFLIDVLSEEESWSLFQSRADDVAKNANLQYTAIQLAQRCAGLPFAIVTMAASLRGRGISYWKEALRILDENNHIGMKETIYSIVEFSYNQLEDDEVKQVFLLCGLHGPSISVSDLLKYVIGLGVFKHVISIDDARSKLHRIIADLEKSSLLLRNSAREVNMHDLIHEVASSIAARDGHVFMMERTAPLEYWPREDFLRRCSQIILEGNYIQKLPERLDCPSLYFLYLNTNDNPTLKIPDSFFQGMGNLQVLVFIGINMSSLPASLVSLAKIKTLCFNQCRLQDLVGIEALKSLAILSFFQSDLQKFPSEIGQLTNLRMLDLSSSAIKVIPPNIIPNLTKLEELYVGGSIKWDVESLAMQKENDILAELANLTNLTALELQIREASISPWSKIFEKLETYNIVIGDKWGWSDSNGTSRLLKLNLDASFHKQEIKAIVKGVEDLYLEEINGFSNVLCELNGEGFPLLKKLHIQNNTTIQHIVYSSERNQTPLFPNLETMILDNLNNLKEICHRPLAADLFEMLNHLTVYRCHKLKYLLHRVLEDLQQLKTIDISDCESLEQVFEDEQAIQTRKSHVMDVLPVLHSLKLSNLPKLASMCSGAVGVASRSLTQMTIENCPKFSFTFAYSLRRIEEQGPSKKKSKEMIVIPSKLKKLNLQEVDDLKNMCEYPLFSLAYLTSLQLSNCNKLEYLFSFSMAQELSSLKVLKIISCPTIEQIVKRETEERANVVEFPKVKTLILDHLPRFTGMSKQDGSSVEWLVLETVSITECPNIRKSMMGKVDRPLLKKVTAANCTPRKYEGTESKIGYLFNLTDELSNLPYLRIEDSKQLKNYMEMNLQESSFTQLQTVEALQCDNELNKFLSILLRRSHMLDRLTIENCELLEQVFDLTEFVDEEQEGNLKFPHLKTMQLLCLPKLKCIWNKDPRRIVELGKLVKLEIIKCGLCMSPLSTSLLEKLVLLEELKIESCEMIEHVVEDDTEMREISFPNLKNLQLASLPKLIKFNSGSCDFGFPSLEILKIEKCPELNAFTTGFLNNQTLTNGGTSEHVTSNEVMHACPNLQMLTLADLKVVEVDSLRRLENLKTLIVRNCSSLGRLGLPSKCFNLKEIEVSGCDILEKIFTDPEPGKTGQKTFGYLESIVLENLKGLSSFSLGTCEFPSLKNLRLVNCPALRTLNKHSASLVLFDDIKEDSLAVKGQMKISPQLESLELADLPNMQLWKQEPQIPVFQNLKDLRIMRCRGIEKLFSISVIEHLSVLKFLKLYECTDIVQVLGGGGGNSKQVVFPKLETLVLKHLPSLTSFCEDEDVDFEEFPELNMVRVEDVPNMNTFVKKPLIIRTPKLKQVRVTFITKCWLGDLNKTITYLHENRGKLENEVWECDQSSTRHHSDIAESSSRNQTTQLGEKNFESDS